MSFLRRTASDSAGSCEPRYAAPVAAVAQTDADAADDEDVRRQWLQSNATVTDGV